MPNTRTLYAEYSNPEYIPALSAYDCDVWPGHFLPETPPTQLLAQCHKRIPASLGLEASVKAVCWAYSPPNTCRVRVRVGGWVWVRVRVRVRVSCWALSPPKTFPSLVSALRLRPLLTKSSFLSFSFVD